MAKDKKDYRSLSLEELKTELLKLEKKYQDHRFEKVVGDARQTHQLKKARKDIARVKTFIRQHELGMKK
ncbi:50S ribosomal protein L29 [uncultured Brachyspira sp.]|uniref:50S ribosomal protein L29 n=1 Tax=uncultured Brachyspira sp. TaxID=221953 RepID=UPI0025CD9E33|nr:50S ribosomal protein L29 [uncultured Brachyspira sp.]